VAGGTQKQGFGQAPADTILEAKLKHFMGRGKARVENSCCILHNLGVSKGRRRHSRLLFVGGNFPKFTFPAIFRKGFGFDKNIFSASIKHIYE
jgi:hypothetical protein